MSTNVPANDQGPETFYILYSKIVNFDGDFSRLVWLNNYDLKSISKKDRERFLKRLKIIIRGLNTLSEKIETSIRPEIARVKPSENFIKPSECGSQSAYQKSAIDRWNKFTLDEK